ncbi:MAG: GNAT family N-acetyltransferase, partial [Phycisphaerales bacterium]
LFTRWVETTIETDNNRTAWRRAAFLEDGTFVGCFNLIKVERGLDWRCDANCWVDAIHQRLGYAREGVEALLHYATADLTVGLGLHRVIAMIQPENTASCRVAESLGFKETGESDLLDINGVPRIHNQYEYIDL